MTRHRSSKAFIVLALSVSLLMVLPAIQVSEGIPSRGPGTFDALYGPNPVIIDGVASPGEWDVPIGEAYYNATSGMTLSIYAKEDGKDLFLSLQFEPDLSTYTYVEIYLDPNNDRGSTIQADDIQLQIFSGSLHESSGAGGTWNSVPNTKWTAESTLSCVEVSVEYSKLGIIPGIEKEMGLSLMWFGDDDSLMIPFGYDPYVPSTWGSINSSDLWEGAKPKPNTPPVLSDEDMSPSYGFPDTEFRYEIRYNDAEGDPPATQEIVIDGSSFDMIYDSDDIFEYRTQLDPGDHSYHFNFSDGKNSTRYPALGEFDGPFVYVPNYPPWMDRGEIPSGTFSIDEDEMQSVQLIDLEHFFTDDRDDGNLTFSIVHEEDRDILDASVDGQWLVVELKEPNWHGEMDFQVEAEDRGIAGLDLMTYQLRSLSNHFSISVDPLNDDPWIDLVNGAILSEGSEFVMLTGSEGATEDVPFILNVRATDPDFITDMDEGLSYSIDDNRVQIKAVDERSGRITFLPTDIDVGFKDWNITVSDLSGANDTINVNLEVANVPDQPVIESGIHQGVVYIVVSGEIVFDDGLSADEDEPFSMSIVVRDDDMLGPGDRLYYELETERDDVTIDPDRGDLTFLPGQEDVGLVKIKIKVTDQSGLWSSVTIEIPVLNSNDPPTISSVISSTGKMAFIEGDTAFITIDYSDPDMSINAGDAISVSWSSNISGDLGSGDILNISKLKVGRHNITVKIADRAGASASRSFEVTIEEKPSRILPTPVLDVVVIGGSVISSLMMVTILVLMSFLIYSRAKEKSVLDNMNRKLIFEAVKLKPGVHFMALSEELGLAIGVLSHHLNILEKKQLVKSMQDGKFRRFYLYDEKIEFKLTLTTIQQTIIYIVKQDPGITQSHISEKMGKNKMVVNYHIKILKDVGLLSVERNGRETNCFPTIACLNLAAT